MPLGDSTAHAALELARESAVHTARRGARPGRPRPAAHAARELALELGPAAVHTARELARELARLGCSGLPLVGTFFTVNRT